MVKRVFDIVVSLVAIFLLSPFLVTLAIAVRVKLGSPILFRQTRPGMGGAPFDLVKFRTMTDLRDDDGELLSDEVRLTRFGKWLRSTSLDELPELWNILKGEMSLVGPRPLLMDYLPLYSPAQSRRHEVRPGVTGWAQVTGRNSLTWPEKFAKDIWYVDNRSFGLDLRILWLTVRTVLRREGISAAGEATTAPFRGNRLSDL